MISYKCEHSKKLRVAHLVFRTASQETLSVVIRNVFLCNRAQVPTSRPVFTNDFREEGLAGIGHKSFHESFHEAGLPTYWELGCTC